MAKSRLAMVECDVDCVTPWTRSSGLEIAAEATGIGQGDVVKLEVLLRTDDTQTIDLDEGTTPLDSSGWRQYRLIKFRGEEPKRTTVLMLLR